MYTNDPAAAAYEKARHDIMEGLVKMREALWGTDLEYLDCFLDDCRIIIRHAEKADECIDAMAREIKKGRVQSVTQEIGW